MNARTLCAAGLLTCLLAASQSQAQPKPNKPVSVSTHIARWANWTQRALLGSRRERDVVRMRCLDARLSELHALERSALQHERLLASTRPQRARLARAALHLNYLGARNVYNEARRCGGAGIQEVGDQVRFWIDPRVPRYEPSFPEPVSLPLPPHATR